MSERKGKWSISVTRTTLRLLDEVKSILRQYEGVDYSYNIIIQRALHLYLKEVKGGKIQ